MAIKKDIYCLMVTDRIDWARTSVANFLKQEYVNKKLLIFNNNLTENVCLSSQPGVVEYMISKGGRTLGQLRNISLDYVPMGSYWFTWDDDDERHPKLLGSLMDAAIKNHSKYVLFKNRLNFNCHTNSLWRSSDSRGLKHFLAYKDNQFQYLNKNTLEDLPANDLLSNTNKSAILLDNNPTWYVRFTHGDNTSPFVNVRQSTAVLNSGPYTESRASEQDFLYIQSFVKNYSRVCPPRYQ